MMFTPDVAWKEVIAVNYGYYGKGTKGYIHYMQDFNHRNGKNGKGYYNDIFAPGWVVASLWELLSPGRAEQFIGGK